MKCWRRKCTSCKASLLHFSALRTAQSHWRARTTDLEEDDVRPTADIHSIFSRPPQGGHILNGQVTELLILKILRIFCSIPSGFFLHGKQCICVVPWTVRPPTSEWEDCHDSRLRSRVSWSLTVSFRSCAH